MNIHGRISYASLQQTAGKHLARTLMKQSLSLAFFFSFTPSFSMRLHPLHQPCSLSITICLISFLSFLLQHSFSHLSVFLHSSVSAVGVGGSTSSAPPHHHPSKPPTLLSPSFQHWGCWSTWHPLMITPITVRQPPPAWPRCLLITLIWSAQPEALSALSLLPFWPTNYFNVTLCMLWKSWTLWSHHWTSCLCHRVVKVFFLPLFNNALHHSLSILSPLLVPPLHNSPSFVI